MSVEEDDEDVDVEIELDADTLDAIASAKDFVSTYDSEVLHEVDLAEAETKAKLEARAAAALDRVLSNNSASAELVLGIAGDDIPEVENVEDMQGPHGFRKYDEDAEAGISLEQKAAVAKYKLTKNELANLVPQVGRRAGSCGGGGLVRDEVDSSQATCSPLTRMFWLSTGLGHHQH